MFHLGKKIWIFIICFAVIAGAVTTAAILYSNANKGNISFLPNNNVEEKNTKISSDGLGIKSLNDTYNLNDILVLKQETYYGEELKKENNTTYHTWNINYLKITGLKNKMIEDSINDKIKDIAINSVVKEAKAKDSYGYAIDCYCNANFSNVISFTFYNSYYNYTDTSYSTSLNFNLITGEEIKFSDLFTNTASLKHIITQSAYTCLAIDRIYSTNAVQNENEVKSASTNEMKYGVDMNGIDYSNIEEKICEMLNDYYSGNKINFNFTPKVINIRYNGATIEIIMKNFYQDIAIYSRYANNNSIYDGTYSNEKNVIVFIDRTNSYYSKLDINGEDTFFDFKIGVENQNSDDNIYDNTKFMSIIKKYISDETEKIAKMKQDKRDNALLYSITVSTTVDSNNNLILYEDILTMEMDKQYFKDTYRNYAIECAQAIDEDFAYTNNYYIKDDEMSSKVKATYSTDEKIYNIDTNTYDIKTTEYKDGKTITKIVTYNRDTGEKISETEN